MSPVTNAVLLICFCDLYGCVNGQTATDAKALKTKLFVTDAYDTVIRPINDQSDPIHVLVEFYLLAINFLDEVTETLKTTGYLRMLWHDEFLVWDPASYGDLSLYHWPQSSIWKPDVTLKNSYLDYKKLGDQSLNVEVDHDGLVLWAPFQVFQSTCAIDITYFPYDEQTCSLTFVAWSYTKLQVIMEGGKGGISLDEFEPNSAWEVTNTTWYNYVDDAEASIIFVLQMKRKPLYNLLTLVFPVIMLAILNLFVFALPSEGGEKAGYAVTVFLAFAVFLTIMEASFPKSSDTTAIFAIYVVIQTVQSTLITIIALLMIRGSAFGEDTAVPSCLICLTRLLKCKQIRQKFRENKVTEQTASKLNANELDSVNRNKKIIEMKVEEETVPDLVYTWKNVLNTLDLIFFIFFLLAFVISTMVCLLLANKN